MSFRRKSPDDGRLDRIVADARRQYEQREQDYRARALKLFPWVCGRCGRGFDRANLRELTVHHKDHDHANNPPDGSNWELLCLYCHDNEHQRFSDQVRFGGGTTSSGGADAAPAAHRPFADLRGLLGGEDPES